MALTTIWVVADCRRTGKPLPVTLELLTKARELAGSVEAVAWGPTTADIAADARRVRGGQGPRRRRPRRRPSRGARRWPPSRPLSPAGALDAVLIPHTYDGRDIAARLSVKLDRPVLTNVTGLRLDGDKLVVEHAIFGGNLARRHRVHRRRPGHLRA